MSTYIGRVLEGKYRLIRLLGAGGMGEVYEAHHALIDRRLAVKLLHPEYAGEEDVVRRFQREAKASTAIGHEHIIDITDMGVADTGELFIVMEYLEGRSLGQVMEDEGALAPGRACHVMAQMLSALEAAHGKGIIHRDLKPDNVFLTHRGPDADYVKLLDFGISKVKTSDDGMTKGLTRTGQILGTPSYMSPEQARGETNVTASTDIYSAGVILYEILTGVLPYEGPSFPALLIKILTEEAADPLTLKPDLPPALADAIRVAMSKDPADRFPDVASFRTALAPFSKENMPAGSMVKNVIPDMPPRGARSPVRKTPARLATTPLDLVRTSPARKRGKMRVVAGILSATAILLVGFVAYLAFSRPNGQSAPAPAAPAPLASVAAPPVVPAPPIVTPAPAPIPAPAQTADPKAPVGKGRKTAHEPTAIKVPAAKPSSESDKPPPSPAKRGKDERDLDEVSPW
ncbi:MAG: serine/threonine-protein kinase [Deltaproteobacteria bacterium]|nr:serine/threonine-protein kinase [Deltaproteobacteria bacterium]